MSARTYTEGDRVMVTGPLGRALTATVAQDWDGDGPVMLLFAGKAKPVPRAASRVRPVDRPGGAPLGEYTPPRSTTARPELKAQPKPPGPVRSTRYLSFVRTHPCSGCGAKRGVEAHHWAPQRSLARKVDDTRTVPLCQSCHAHVHAHGRLPNLDAMATRIMFLEKQVTLLTRYYERSRSQERTDPPLAAPPHTGVVDRSAPPGACEGDQ